MSDIWSGWDQTDAYDPDMTVGEALDAGLIAVIDSGVIGRNYKGACGFESDHYVNTEGGSLFCTRELGHDGTHAYVARWEGDPRKEAEHLRGTLARTHVRANSHRAQDLIAALEKTMKRVEELERVQRETERMEAAMRAERDRLRARQKAVAAAQDTKRAFAEMGKAAQKAGATFDHVLYDEIEESTKASERALDRMESLLEAKRSRQKFIQPGSQKRNRINPKGQR